MHQQTSRLSREDGVAMVYMAVALTGLLLFSGLAIDGGRAYVVKAQLTKAVDGAALGAARNLNSGNPRGAAASIFTANFPAGTLGTTSVTNPNTDAGFYALRTDAATGINVVTITATAVVPTTLMTLGHMNTVTVTSTGEATRRMVDLSLVLDVSSSIGAQWTTVRDAVRDFIGAFDPAHDRMSLLTFGNGASVLDAMPASRGFDKVKLTGDVPSTLPGGSTNMVEGLYRGWDELRTVPAGTQSGLRIIVLFTDGASNSVPGNYDALPGQGRSLRTYDFPKNLPDPGGQTWDTPHIEGLYDAQSGASSSPFYSLTVTNWNSNQTVAGVDYLPLQSFHAHHRSSGIPTAFPLQTNTLTVNGVPQQNKRGLRHLNGGTGRYPAEVFNINNAARNLLEIIADQARNDNGDYRIRLYTIGMGDLVRYNLGTMPEKPEDILKRISNDKTSPDFNAAQLEGKYFFAQTASDVGVAFQGIQNQILRLSK